MKKCLYLLLLLLFLPSLAEGALTEDQLRTIWRNNGAVEGIQVFRYGVVDWQGGSVAAEGRAPVRSPSPSSRLLAKRAALADARRNLLFLLYEMKFGLPERLTSIEVQGELVEDRIDYLAVRDGISIVGVTVPLDRFLSESLIFSGTVR